MPLDLFFYSVDYLDLPFQLMAIDILGSVDGDMSIISLSPCYIPLVQKPSCCAVTCLQMILFRNENKLFDQEQLAIDFGVKILPEDAAAFTSRMPIMTNPAIDEGVQTVESEKQINDFLQRVSPRLKATSFKHSRIASLTEFLVSNIQKNNDVWVEYHSEEIHPNDERKGKYLHDGLIESIDLANGHVHVIDSMPGHRQRVAISLPMLEVAISSRLGRETGFVVIEKR